MQDAGAQVSGLFLLLLIVLIAAVGTTLMIWLFQLWRRSLRNPHPPRSAGPGPDAWETAAQRMRLDSGKQDDQN